MRRYKINIKANREEYSKVIYGDSVVGNTSVLLRNPLNGFVTFKKIEDIGIDWKVYPGFKFFDTTIKSPKETSVTSYQCWSDKGWTDIKRVIRHKTNKQIYQIFTEVGYVKVTEDHSILDNNYNILKPKNCDINTPLLCRYPTDYNFIDTGLSCDNAYMSGVMFGDCEYSSVPDEILNGTHDCCEQFLRGFNSVDYTELSDVGLAGLYYIHKKLGMRVMLSYNDGEVSLIKGKWLPNSKIKINEPVNNIGNDYVYDIETEIGRFGAGIGELIVKNTDSCMIELNTPGLVKYKKLVDEYNEVINLTEKEELVLQQHKTLAVKEAFEEGKKIADLVTKSLFKSPINLEFEKVYTNFLILSKKRYMGNYHGESPEKIDFVEKKGVVLKRRDNPEIVKKIYSGVVNPLLEHGKRGIDMSIKFLKTELEKLMNNQVDLQDLVITKKLAKGYGKVSNSGEVVLKDGDYSNMNLPHVSLANKMRKRDPGSAPLVGDRISYVFINLPEDPKAKLYERAEELTVVIDKKLEIDYLYYITNQIQNPVSEIIKILVKDYEKIFTDATKEAVGKKAEQVKTWKIKKSIPKGQLSILRWIQPIEKK